MTDTLVGKYFVGGSAKDEQGAVHGVVVGEIGRDDGMFLLVRYLDWDRHEELTYLRVVRLGSVLVAEGGWRFFPTKDAVIDWLAGRG